MGDGTGFPQIYYNNAGDTRKITDIIQWGTGKWISMAHAFHGSDEMGVSAADVPDLTLVTDMNNMFRGATSVNQDVSNWNTANVTNMGHMFDGATSAIPDMSNWDITGITSSFGSMELILSGITLPTVLYDATLANFNAQITVSGIVFDGGNSKYCNVAVHDRLINTHGWTITDGGLDSNCSIDDIFSNSFENVIVFKAVQSQFSYDFSEVSINAMDDELVLIAKGIDEQHKPVIQIYLRNDVGQLQIRLDKLDTQDGDNFHWLTGQW